MKKSGVHLALSSFFLLCLYNLYDVGRLVGGILLCVSGLMGEEEMEEEVISLHF